MTNNGFEAEVTTRPTLRHVITGLMGQLIFGIVPGYILWVTMRHINGPIESAWVEATTQIAAWLSATVIANAARVRLLSGQPQGLIGTMMIAGVGTAVTYGVLWVMGLSPRWETVFLCWLGASFLFGTVALLKICYEVGEVTPGTLQAMRDRGIVTREDI